jgi:hypothetical protein
MSADDPEDLDLADWPDALDAYRRAYELGRRIAFRAGTDLAPFNESSRNERIAATP